MKIWRKGMSARQWSDDPSTGRLSTIPGRYFKLKFWMPSKGGGDTEVMVEYEPADFGKLAKAMAIVDMAATLRAFGEVLVDPPQPPIAAKPPVVGFQSTSPPAPVAREASQ
jgi:hypothetical protein